MSLIQAVKIFNVKKISKMTKTINPYGDGKSSIRIIKHLEENNLPKKLSKIRI